MAKKANTSKRAGEQHKILTAITPQTRVIALVAMIGEALFVVASCAVPQEQRLMALIVCAMLLFVAISACVWLELAQRHMQSSSNTDLHLPRELKGNVFWIDPATQTDRSAGADLYRTASNFKFAGRYEEAIAFYKRVLEVQPSHWKARYNIGSCLYYLDRLQEAELHFKRLADDLKEIGVGCDSALREGLHGCYIQLNAICDKRHDFIAGSRYLHESLLVKPDDALSYLNLVISAIKAGNKQEALKWYEILLQHPQQLQVMSSLAPEDRKHLESVTNQKEVSS